MPKKKAEAPTNVAATELAEAPETQSLVFKRSHPAYAYWPGDKADLTAEHVKLLVDGGFAELASTEE